MSRRFRLSLSWGGCYRAVESNLGFTCVLKFGQVGNKVPMCGVLWLVRVMRRLGRAFNYFLVHEHVDFGHCSCDMCTGHCWSFWRSALL